MMHYSMRIVADITLTVDEKLSSELERPFADTLKSWLSPMFSGTAHDLCMNFYALDGLQQLQHQTKEIINASSKTYTLYLPREDYMHLAIANAVQDEYIGIEGDGYAASLRLEQRSHDTVPTHPIAQFTARLEMHMSDTSITEYNVHLYTVSSAVALIVTQHPATMPPLDMFVAGMATGFEIRDSVYTYDRNSLIRAERITDRCYGAVTLPSRGSKPSAGPMHEKQMTEYWSVRVYAHLADGTTTETILSVDTPLDAGKIEIIKVQLNDDGSLTPVETTHIGASVTLDWKEGSSHEIDI